VAIIPLVTSLARWFCLLLSVGCDGPEPVLQGVPPAPLLAEPAEEAAAAPAASERPPDPRSANPEYYRKADHVWVDVLYLGGREWQTVRGEASNQLGALLETADLPGDLGTELRFARGSVRVSDDRIYMIKVPLPEPMRRGSALEAIGFPTYTGDYLVLHREYRLNNERGFRRIRMKRLDRTTELVTEVEAWRWIPGEHGARR
jgi:hypothetical protein